MCIETVVLQPSALRFARSWVYDRQEMASLAKGRQLLR